MTWFELFKIRHQHGFVFSVLNIRSPINMLSDGYLGESSYLNEVSVFKHSKHWLYRKHDVTGSLDNCFIDVRIEEKGYWIGL